jgi:hypothetical protein
LDWRQYESEVGEILKERVGGDAEVLTNTRIRGLDSGSQRQIDVLIKGCFAVLVDATLIADCKFFATKVDVTDVEQFMGLVHDVRADLGLLVTTEGYTRAAQEVARKARGIHVEVLSIEELLEWRIPLLDCEACAIARDPEKLPGMFWLDSSLDLGLERAHNGDEDGTVTVRAGACEVCGTWHVQCPGCDTIAMVNEWLVDQWVECEGGCGVEYNFSGWYDPRGEGGPEERLTVRLPERLA